MPLQVPSFFVPVSLELGVPVGKHPYDTNLTPPFVVEDIYVRGGFRCLPSIEVRNKIPRASCKKGMLVYTPEENGKIWRCKEITGTAITWEELTLGGGAGGGVYTASEPITIINNNIEIDPNRVLPKITLENNRDDIVALDIDRNPYWKRFSDVGLIGQRVYLTYTTENQLDIMNETSEKFQFKMGSLIIMIGMSIDMPDMKIQIFSTPERDERNPYTFISTEELLTDEGITELMDGSFDYKRKYSILANMEDPLTDFLYFTVTYLANSDASKDSNGAIIRYRQPTIEFAYVTIGSF